MNIYRRTDTFMYWKSLTIRDCEWMNSGEGRSVMVFVRRLNFFRPSLFWHRSFCFRHAGTFVLKAFFHSLQFTYDWIDGFGCFIYLVAMTKRAKITFVSWLQQLKLRQLLFLRYFIPQVWLRQMYIIPFDLVRSLKDIHIIFLKILLFVYWFLLVFPRFLT